MKDEKKWYRCTNRNELIILITAGFDYTNFRPDKYHDGQNVYYFERTNKLDEFLLEKFGRKLVKKEDNKISN